MPRRVLLRPRLALAVVLALGAAPAACAPGETGPGGDPTGDVVGPFGAPAGADLEVYVFDGGYGAEYTDTVVDLYHRGLPGSRVDVSAVQEIATQLQPRFVAGNPPDLVDNSGRPLEVTTLADAGQLTDLAPLLAAPSFDDPAVTVGETLVDGVVQAGTHDGTLLELRYVNTAYGLWYSRSLFDRHGWTVPTTWDELLALGEQAKAEGIALLAYPGQAMSYLADVFVALVGKQAGLGALEALDNLEPGAWRAPAVVAAFDALAGLRTRGLVLDGCEGLDHTQAQTAFVRGEALFYPAGSWLENEMRHVTPAGFEMAIAPVPLLDDDAALDAAALTVVPGEPFVVPARAANPAGAMEFLRAMLSREAAADFTRRTGVPTVVRGTTGDADLPALRTVTEAIDAGAQPQLRAWFRTWYEPLRTQVFATLGDVLAGRVTAQEAATTLQETADDVAADDAITKHTRR
ncbi:N-acetylglucosamine/diacetylchitobiose ABC transporter substrate-binding protein [Xylanimonas allomyrinae]|uniref:N-acetylglucosamine/diacetylchitobiose ABC transporter substrate-binding protein n=1 Tax=Xylanimonas allomyrinae TaxID=2509459 RepID=UPI0013A63DE7|nr:N-acetylglucosamine/diacetylchitobiose ABC transporter substrate-binding protein [Xylanimonas allomyrinae]